jgi:hypothetical protein
MRSPLLKENTITPQLNSAQPWRVLSIWFNYLRLRFKFLYG